MSRVLVLDLATAPLENAAEFITTDDISAPSNYKDPAAIARYVEGEKAKRLEKAALDPDTCRITALGFWRDCVDSPLSVIKPLGVISDVALCRDESREYEILNDLSNLLYASDYRVVSFNGFRFDLPVIVRRCAYLGLPVPDLNLDRYRSPHVDLYDRLTYHGAVTGHSLSWYVKRHGWTDLVKPLTGAEEAQVPQTGRWDDLAASVRHDLTATHRLARWLGVVPRAAVAVPEPIV